MPGKLQAEIHQTRPFATVEEEAVLNIVRTAEVLQRTIADFLKEFDLSPTQYNVLRILRGAGAAGATCSQIGERLLTHDPDITRLLDRMEARELIARERSSTDRRAIVTRISEDGLALVDSIDSPIRTMTRLRMGKFGRDALARLIGELERVREAFEITSSSVKAGNERKTK
jgi:DNA-binding MarR family transcriptional regulator